MQLACVISASSSTAVSCSASPLYMLATQQRLLRSAEQCALANAWLPGVACPVPGQPVLKARVAGCSLAGLPSG